MFMTHQENLWITLQFKKGNNKIELHLEKGIYLLKMENAHVKLQID